MSKGNSFENALLLLIFNNTDIANIGDTDGLQGSATAGSLYVALHTGDPGEAGSATTSEATYTNYARVAVARSDSGWTVSGNTATNAAAVEFPEAGAASDETLTHFSITTASSGASLVLYKGALGVSLPVVEGVAPYFEAGDIDISED